MSWDVERSWKLLNVEDSVVNALVNRHGLDKLTATILARRGVTRPVEVEAFLGRCWLPSTQIDGMRAAVNRVCCCRGQQVYVFGDPDVDGIAATALLVEMFRRLGARVRWRIRSGLCRASGISDLRLAEEKEAKLIVVVESMIRWPEIKDEVHGGCDVLVVGSRSSLHDTDPSVFILNPVMSTRDNSNQLATSAVVMKLAQAVHDVSVEKVDRSSLEVPYDLSTLGTLAAHVPLTGENRDIIVRGLQMMAPSGRPGLLELWIRVGQSAPEPTAGQVSRLMNPVIESAACYEEGGCGVELLVSRDRDQCVELAEHLLDLNERRRRDTMVAWNRLVPLARRISREQPEGGCLVVEDPELMRGMTGFLSFRLSRFLNRPVAVVSCKDDVISGSIRSSGDGADALELLTLASDLIMTSGGNQSAGEFVAEKQIIGELQQCWSGSSYTAKNVRHRSRPDGALDADLHTSELTPALDRLIDNFEPTGLGSEQLVFRTRGLQVAEVSLVGHSSEHCKLLLDSGTYRWPAFYWRGGATVAAQIVSGDIVDVIYRLEISHGDGERRLHMVVLDLFQGDK